MLNFFHKIVDTLQEHNIPYMLSGSIAMGIYVTPRATRDFDFVVLLKEENIERFASAFRHGFYCDADSIRDAIKHKSIFNIIDYESGYKADFVILKDSPFRQGEFQRKKIIDFMGEQVSVVSIEDLLLSKLIWIQDLNSSIQADDIKQLAQAADLDMPYIRRWIKELNLNTFNLL